MAFGDDPANVVPFYMSPQFDITLKQNFEGFQAGDRIFWNYYTSQWNRRDVAPTQTLDANRTQAPAAPVPTPNADKLDDVLYGQVIPISGGRRLVRGRPLWWSEPRLITTSQSSTGTATVMDIAVSFGYPLTSTGKRGILKIKAGINSASTTIYDLTVSPPVNAIGLDFTFYQGDETQLPDPTIQAQKGVGQTSAYRGQMYAVFKNFPIDLFSENGNLVAPLFAALIADNMLSGMVAETWHITTGSTIRTPACVDWTGGIAYFSGRDTTYRLQAFDLWAPHTMLRDVAITNLSSAFNMLEKVMLFVDPLGLILAMAAATFPTSIDDTFVLINPTSGAIVFEGPHIAILNAAVDANGQISCAADTTGSLPVYVFAVYAASFGHFAAYKYDGTAISLVASTGAYLDGHAATLINSYGPIVAGNSESGQAVFYCGSSTALFKVVVNLATAALTITSFWTSPSQINNAIFLPSENTITVFLSSGVATKLDSTGAVLWSTSPGFTVNFSGAAGPIIQTTETWRRTRPFFGYVGTSTFYILNLNDGTVDTIAGTGGAPPTTREMIFDTETLTFIFSDFGGDPVSYRLGATSSGSYAFSDLVLGMANRAGYLAGQVTVTNIPDTFEGVIIDRDTPFLDFLQANAELLNYRIVEDQNIRIFRIPDSPTIDFAIDDTLCVDNGRDGPITARDEQETSFAAILEIQYRDPVVDYQYNSQTVQRPRIPVPTTASNRKDTIQSPLIMSADQAVTLVTPVIYRRAAASTKLTVNGLPVLCAAAPGDLITATMGSNTYTAVVVQSQLDGSLQNQLTAQVILTQSAFTGAGAVGGAGVFSWTTTNPASTGYLVDGPIINYLDDLGGRALRYLWLATDRGQSDWPGALFYFSYDGTTYTAAPDAAVSTQIVHVGSAINALPDNPIPFSTDYTNTLTVAPLEGDFTTLASVTYAQLMNGATLAFFGQPGRWEVIGFQTVTNNGDGTYSFSGLARGLFGTEVFSGQHVPGDIFIFDGSSDTGLHQGAFLNSNLGSTLDYKAVGNGQAVGSAVTKVSTVSGNAEKPPAPVHLDAVISGSDIAISWGKRSRFVQHLTNWNILESETADEWSIDIMSGSTVLRTLSATTPSVTYLAANITTDFGGMPASLKFRVYRVGHNGAQSVGRGFRAEKTVALS